MDVVQVVDQLAPLVGLAIQTLAATLQGYQTFKKSNVEGFFRLLLADSPTRIQGLERIGQSEDMQRLFFSVIDRVASEERQEKIRNWKNMLVHLATDFSKEEFGDTYTRTLDTLSVLDLTILYQAYSAKQEGGEVEQQVVKSLSVKGVDPPLVIQSIKRLASNGLFDEMQNVPGSYYGSVGGLSKLSYAKNDFGRKFLRLISDDEIV